MIMQGKFTLNGSLQEVWNFLLKLDMLAPCIPGVEKVEPIDDKSIECIVKQKVGPISVRFKFITSLVEEDYPRHIKVVGRGADMGKAGRFEQRTTIDLTELSANEVEISYLSNVNIVGRLATFGDRIMRAKAKSLEEEFTKNLEEKLRSYINISGSNQN